MENLAQTTGWKSYSRKRVLKLLQVDIEEQITCLLWNAIMAMPNKKKYEWGNATNKTMQDAESIFKTLF